MSLTLTLAAEWAPHDIRVNCILPGLIDTPATSWDKLPPPLGQAMLGGIPLKRWGLPQDIAITAVFLASEASSYITGSCLEVTGGLAMHV
jgi:2-deoxy-D-gluconate 3-dehydrogenase